jgi:hypothetical protein
MAGDWIKMRADLQTHPKVVRIMSALGADKLRVIGGLHAVWCLFDVHSEDGRLLGYTPEALDQMIGWSGFSQAVANVDWLAIGDGFLYVPRFDEHNGQSAKRRAMEAQRKREERAKVVPIPSASNADKKRTREEKRRSNTPQPPDGGSDSAFEAFWEAWPKHTRKVAKAQCLAKWHSKGCEAIASQIVDSVNAAKRSTEWLKSNGEFIPAPLVWLNQARWDATPGQGPAPAQFMGAA